LYITRSYAYLGFEYAKSYQWKFLDTCELDGPNIPTIRKNPLSAFEVAHKYKEYDYVIHNRHANALTNETKWSTSMSDQ
jgi:hypothetical protein